MTLLLLLGLVLLGSILSVLAAGAYLLVPERARRRILSWTVHFATGTLLGAAFLGLLPKALQRASAHTVLTTCLIGILIFLVLEKLIVWRHCHRENCSVHSRAADLILIGDAFHNFIDGVAIAAALVLSVPLGIATGFAVIAHEIPQEVGDFGILLAGGYAPRRALTLNTISSLASIPGALLTYFLRVHMLGVLPYIMALSAASFIYIAIADLIPGSHADIRPAATASQVTLIVLGGAVIFLLVGHM